MKNIYPTKEDKKKESLAKRKESMEKKSTGAQILGEVSKSSSTQKKVKVTEAVAENITEKAAEKATEKASGKITEKTTGIVTEKATGKKKKSSDGKSKNVCPTGNVRIDASKAGSTQSQVPKEVSKQLQQQKVGHVTKNISCNNSKNIQAALGLPTSTLDHYKIPKKSSSSPGSGVGVKRQSDSKSTEKPKKKTKESRGKSKKKMEVSSSSSSSSSSDSDSDAS